VLVGTDFFTVEVLTVRGLVTYYVLFFIHLESRRVEIAGIVEGARSVVWGAKSRSTGWLIIESLGPSPTARDGLDGLAGSDSRLD
jgi:hypothetical protein